MWCCLAAVEAWRTKHVEGTARGSGALAQGTVRTNRQSMVGEQKRTLTTHCWQEHAGQRGSGLHCVVGGMRGQMQKRGGTRDGLTQGRQGRWVLGSLKEPPFPSDKRAQSATQVPF